MVLLTARKRYLSAATAMVLGLIATAPALAQSYIPYIGEIRTLAFDFCPVGWAPMHGQLLSIEDYNALFALIGTRYGGDGQTTFALPVGIPVYSATGEPFLQCIALEGVFPSQN